MIPEGKKVIFNQRLMRRNDLILLLLIRISAFRQVCRVMIYRDNEGIREEKLISYERWTPLLGMEGSLSWKTNFGFCLITHAEGEFKSEGARKKENTVILKLN